MEFIETLEQFKKLFQGTESYFGKSKPLGQKTQGVKKNIDIGQKNLPSLTKIG